MSAFISATWGTGAALAAHLPLIVTIPGLVVGAAVARLRGRR